MMAQAVENLLDQKLQALPDEVRVTSSYVS